MNLKLSTKNKIIGFAFILPGMLFLGSFFLYPVLRSFYTSFFTYKIGRPLVFNGITSYIEIFQNDRFWYSLYTTFKYAILSTVLEFVGAFIFALTFNNTRRVKYLRGLLIIPLVLPSPVMVGLWRYILQPDYGLLNNFLSFIGVMGKKITYLNSPSLALYSVIIVQTTWTVFIVMFLLLAGLKAIRHEFYEAAMIDGANTWNKFTNITLPLLKPTITFIVIFRMMDLLQAFTTIYLMIGGASGGSLKATDVLSILVYREAFTKFNFGAAAALSFVIYLFILIFVLIYMKASKTYEDEQLGL